MFQDVLSDNVKDLCLNNHLSDCRFVLLDGETIPAHKIILSSSSKVFKAMLKDEKKADSIQITDDKRSFKSMLRYIYGADVDLENIVHALSTYDILDKYDLAHLQHYCESYIISKVDPISACCTLEFSIIYDNVKIKNACLQVIKYKTKDVFSNQDFFNCSEETLCTILKEDLNISEVLLFQFIEKWAETLINSKGKHDPELSAIKRVIENVRFLTMTLEEFVKGPFVSELLSKRDQRQLLLSISNPDVYKVPQGFCDLRTHRKLSYPSDGVFDISKYWTTSLNELLECQVPLETFKFCDLFWKVVVEVIDTGDKRLVNISLVCIGQNYITEYQPCTVVATLVIRAQSSKFSDIKKVFSSLTFSRKAEGKSFILVEFSELLRGYSKGNKILIQLDLKAAKKF